MTLVPGIYAAANIANFYRPLAASYVDAAGVVQSAGVNVLRNAHYVGGSQYTLLEEAAATNVRLTSEGIFNIPSEGVAANAGTFTTTDSSRIAPDGVTVSGTFTENAASGAHGLFYFPGNDGAASTPAAGEDQCLSLFFQARTGRTWYQFTAIDKAGTVTDSWLNIVTGAWGTTHASHTVTSLALASGWFRGSLGFNAATGATAPNIAMYAAASDGGSNILTGTNAQTFSAWGMQWERGTKIPSSYIKTTGAVVTRPSDLLQLVYGFAPTPARPRIRAATARQF